MKLVFRNLVAGIVLAGSGGVLIPWWILTRAGASPEPVALPGIALITAGAAVCLWCLWYFATLGRGTPGPWDAPRRLVAVGPYRWVRNPIYLGTLLVVLGEVWLFQSGLLALYAIAMAIVFQLFVVAYEEPTLQRRFGESYEKHRATVARWIPRRPRRT